MSVAAGCDRGCALVLQFDLIPMKNGVGWAVWPCVRLRLGRDECHAVFGRNHTHIINKKAEKADLLREMSLFLREMYR